MKRGMWYTTRRDMTPKLKKKRTKEEIKLNAILSSMGEGLIMIDKNFQVILMNQAAGILLRIAPAEAIGKDIHTLFIFLQKGKRIPQGKSPISKAVREASAVSIKLKDDIFCRNRIGMVFPIQMVVTGLLEYGNIRGLIIFSDVTREREIDRIKTEFVALTSHQLRTPLTAVKLFVEMLVDEEVGKLSERQREYMINIQESTERMIQLVNDFLNVSRLEAGTLKIEPEPIQIEDLIRSMIDEVTPMAKSHNCKIVFKSQEEKLPKIPIDSTIMRQVIPNLIVNAIQYSKEGRCDITVTLEQIASTRAKTRRTKRTAKTVQRSKKKGEVLIRVSDKGIGIPQRAQQRIFEKFFRADNAVKTIAEGNGLGLYVAKMILEAAGGKIWFESAGQQKGTTFYVTIPIGGMKLKKGKKSLAG